MASTPASPRAGDASAPASPELTPRSKVKAALAALDDSDDEVTGPIDTKALFARIDKTKQKLNSPRASPGESTDESDDDDAAIIRPRGRIAARMHANFSKAEQPPKSHPDTPRRSRQDETSPSASERNITTKKPSHAGKDDDEGDDDVITSSRRRLARPDRGTTPETAIQADRRSSPGLFVSPSPSKAPVPDDTTRHSDSESDDLPTDLSRSARFQALVEKKKKERLEREAEEERKRSERAQRMREQTPTGSDGNEDDVSDISDDDGGRKLTQDASRPARKASKKALEEMNRETQRLTRGLQLSHEVKTKKKISKASLFQRFNFQPEANTTENENKQTASSRPTTPGSALPTDVEPEISGTPPSSPPSNPKPVNSQLTTTTAKSSPEHKVIPPNVENRNLNKAASQAHEIAPPAATSEKLATKALPRRFRVKLPPAHADKVMVDFDDELNIASPAKKDKLDALIARIPENKAQESREMKTLRHLAHLSSPPREQVRGRKVKPSMTLGELQMSLQQRAKAQAKLERERHLESLRSKGIVVQSAEERQRELETVEDIVLREYRLAEEIAKREREEAKVNRKKEQGHEADPLAWDDSDDDSYGGDKDELQELELSGSEEDEQEEDNDEANASGDEQVGLEEDQTENSLIVEDEAKEAPSENEETPNPISDFSDNDIEEMKGSTIRQLRRSKKAQIISDDEDEDEDEHGDVKATPRPKSIIPKSPSAPGSVSSKTPTSVLRSATKTFIPGLPIAPAAPAGLGLTQIFAGTMDDSQAGILNGSPEELMPSSIGQFPDSQFSATAGQSQHNDAVSDSQPNHTTDSQTRASQTQGLRLHYSQSQAHGFDSLIQEDATQMSGFLGPTQDSGFQDYTPLKQRFIDPPQSTASTVLLSGTQDEAIIQESPLARKRGKLLRRSDLVNKSSLSLLSNRSPQDADQMPIIENDGSPGKKAASSNAFKLMAKAGKRLKKLDKKKSKANEMVEDQAEESEDEYAGLGGADGEDSSEEDEDLIKEMIDDSRENEWDAAKLAGIFADQDRAADAAQVDKLFRDITTGMLRKRRRGGDGHDFDLSDSDDGGEARRRLKRRQFAKMQKALFADERIGKIAENPRTAAFLKSIEDTKDDEEWNIGDNFDDNAPISGSDDGQSQTAKQTDRVIPDSQPAATHRKRPRTDDHEPRPSPDERRAKDDARPASITEIRRSLSTLLDDHNSSQSVIPATDIESDSDGEEGRPSTLLSNKENRRSRRPVSDAVVDRIKLKRNSSSLSTRSAGGSARLAFAAPSNVGSGFKVPALLRRATTNSTMLNSSSNATSSTTTSNTNQVSTGGRSGLPNKATDFGDNGSLKKSAGKRSGINYFAHENERRAKVAEAEKRREAKKWKGVEGRSKVVGNLFGSGSFE
ncbi:MRC1-like domain-containing protein [Xylaria sp. CBS 124048]|nr:MRC1-like domain-containing protein [Xylaria sp. CBS 124048]